MVQNTLGRKWLMTYPESPLKEKMEYYIAPDEQEPEVEAQIKAVTPSELTPEELTFMDPACGSGHILAEAYDLFREIYLERGYRTRDIPRLILEKNLFGLDIDDRAAQMARFTVFMKARGDDRRILNPEKPVQLNVMAIQESKGLDLEKAAEVLLKKQVINLNGKRERQLYFINTKETQGDLKTEVAPKVSKDDLGVLLGFFHEAKTFGSLLRVPENLRGKLPFFDETLDLAKKLDGRGQILAESVRPLVRQAELLTQAYDFVVANPPYMGSKGLNPQLKTFAKNNFPDSKSDLFAMFIEQNLHMAKQHGLAALITMQSWMFLSSFEKLRDKILDTKTITSMIHLGARAFDSISGEVVQTTAFVLKNINYSEYKGAYIRLVDGKSESEKAKMLRDAVR